MKLKPLLILSAVASAMGIKIPAELRKSQTATIKINPRATRGRSWRMSSRPPIGWRKEASRRRHKEIMRRRRANARRN